MTDRTRVRLEVTALAILFGAGSGWGAFQVELSNFKAQLSEFSTQLTRIDTRIAEMYCASVPTQKRAGCR